MTSLVCKVELNKKEGVLITVEDASGRIKQSIVLNDKSITTTSKSNSNESTIVQTPESVSIKCSKFSVEADTITCKSKAGSSYESGTGTSIKAGTTLKAQASTTADLKSNLVNVKGNGLVKISGALIKLQ
ncbi:hypothetical protein [Marinibactrum halimedae]|uniref:Uncharacterized protein n=1 Tax=Marinibactrum halimedae TaxID=1444977 RepID=A0AA37T502_9GAMM|nr:hypothetical protein [Marinibactrum halimedae]MCD9458103.1 hypothetical protein [Marinibactrum halimedae]GLS25037.1 hypothetical protein GCM10007877_07510 [Marinibactrum halimedae]